MPGSRARRPQVFALALACARNRVLSAEPHPAAERQPQHRDGHRCKRHGYAGTGEIVLTLVERGGRCGLQIEASDEGPGIADVERAMHFGFSTSGALGLGLPGVKRLMDEFTIVTRPGRGTQVTIMKWRP